MNRRTPLKAPLTAQDPLLAWGLLGVLALVWGSSFMLIKKSLLVYSVTEVAAGRVFLAFLFFVPVLVRTHRSIPRPLLGYFFISGLLGYLVPGFLFAKAGSQISSALAGTLNSLSPLFTLLIGVLFFGQRTRPVQIAGLLIALGGALLLVLTRGNGTSVTLTNFYVLFAVLATLCYGTNINLVAKHFRPFPALVSTAWIFAGVGPVSFGILLSTDFFAKMSTPTNALPSAYLITLGVVASGLMSILFNRIIQLSSAVFASSVTYLMPIVALSWGMMDSELISRQQWGGTLVILVGVYLINRRKKPDPSQVPSFTTNPSINPNPYVKNKGQ